METNSILPALDPRSRFGTIQLGYDRVDTMRMEHAALCSLVALVMGKANLEGVKAADVVAFTARIQERANDLKTLATKDPEELPAHPQLDLLAWSTVISPSE